jgi:hypothetical protein
MKYWGVGFLLGFVTCVDVVPKVMNLFFFDRPGVFPPDLLLSPDVALFKTCLCSLLALSNFPRLTALFVTFFSSLEFEVDFG